MVFDLLSRIVSAMRMEGQKHRFFSFACTSIGASHVAIDKPCQDFSLCKDAGGYSIAIVCDGHGGDKYFRSDKGSEFAAEAAMEMLEAFIKQTNCLKNMPDARNWKQQLAGSIVVRWNEKLEKYTEDNAFTEEELSVLKDGDKDKIAAKEWRFVYGTTLICVVRTRNCLLGLHIGDGKCVAVDAKGNTFEPIPWDDNCFLNQTTSLCDSDAVNKFRFCFLRGDWYGLPQAVFVGSDGIDDSYPGESLNKFYTALLNDFNTDRTMALQHLHEYLPVISQNGSKDDVSVAGIICCGKV